MAERKDMYLLREYLVDHTIGIVQDLPYAFITPLRDDSPLIRELAERLHALQQAVEPIDGHDRAVLLDERYSVESAAPGRRGPEKPQG